MPKKPTADPNLIRNIADLTQELICDLQEWWEARKPLDQALAIFERHGCAIARISDLPKWCRYMWPPGALNERSEATIPEKALALAWSKCLTAIRQVNMTDPKAAMQLEAISKTIGRLATAQASTKSADEDLRRVREQVDGEYRALFEDQPELADMVSQAYQRKIAGGNQAEEGMVN